MHNTEEIRKAANAHAERAARLFRWATVMSEAGLLGHMAQSDAAAISMKINRQAVVESNRAIELRKVLAGRHVMVM